MHNKRKPSIENQLKYDKLSVKLKLDSLLIKPDPSNVVLNSAAFQNQLCKQLNLNTKTASRSRLKKKNEKVIQESSKPLIPNIILPKILNKFDFGVESENQIIKRKLKYYNSLSFAQKIGLESLPRKPLNEDEWKSIEAKTIQREDTKSKCPICLEYLSLKSTVILSCSHIFHKICLSNFERMSCPYKKDRKCPICRTTNYETKDYYKDKEIFVRISIILIQKFWRGYNLRLSVYREFFKHGNPQSSLLKKRYSYFKILDLMNSLNKRIETYNKETNNTLNEMNAAIIKHDSTTCDVSKNDNTVGSSCFNDKEKWDILIRKQNICTNDLCSICLSQFGSKSIVIISCGHSFHKNCIESFEKYDSYYIHRCPNCRQTGYDKWVFNLSKK